MNIINANISPNWESKWIEYGLNGQFKQVANDTDFQGSGLTIENGMVQIGWSNLAGTASGVVQVIQTINGQETIAHEESIATATNSADALLITEIYGKAIKVRVTSTTITSLDLIIDIDQ
jgi:hypothetical protein